jgi:hypothetical protein
LFLVQLEDELEQLIAKNQQQADHFQNEYDQFLSNLPEFESVLVDLRQSNVELWSEIHTYRSLLVNLLLINNQKTHESSLPIEERLRQIEQYTGFKLYADTKHIWIRI